MVTKSFSNEGEHCEEVGRDYEEIIKSTAVTVQLVEKEVEARRAKVESTRGAATYAGTPEMVAESLQGLVNAGIDYFIVTIPRTAYDHEPQSRFAQRGCAYVRLNPYVTLLCVTNGL